MTLDYRGQQSQPSGAMKHSKIQKPKPIRTWVDPHGFTLDIRITAQNAVMFMLGEKKKEASK